MNTEMVLIAQSLFRHAEGLLPIVAITIILQPPPRDVPQRDYRYPPRAGSPPRDMRDYPGPPVRSSREYYDDRRDYRGPPPYVHCSSL
jgi:hypothetical protein